MTADQFNARCPIGTAVTYRPVAGGREQIASKTRSEAWVLGSGHPVVLIEGVAGGVSLEALSIHDEERA